MENIINKKSSIHSVIDKISEFMNTPYFSICLVVFQLISYFLGLDIFNIALISLLISFSFLFKKNLNVLLVIFLFMATMISIKHSPGAGGLSNVIKEYYFKPVIFITAIISAAIPVSIAIVKCVVNIVKRRIEFNASFYAIIFLGVGFLFNGLGNSPYNPLNLMYGLFMCFFLTILYFAILPQIEINKENIEKLAKQVAIFIVLPLIEMTYSYIEYAKTGANPFTRSNFVFVGWGNRNTIGMILLISLSILFYKVKYESNKKLKTLYWIENVITIVYLLLTYSRQAYLSLFFLVSLYFFVMLIRAPKEKKVRRTIHLVLWLVGSISYLAIFQFSKIFGGVGIDFNLDNRLPLWIKGLDAYTSNPIFGKGFFFIGGDPFVRINSLIPYFVHNTIIEMFGACGLVGGVTYVMYRFITTYHIYFNMSKEKAYPVMACSIFLIMSLVDIHLFDLLGTAIYIVLFAMAMSKPVKDNEKV